MDLDLTTYYSAIKASYKSWSQIGGRIAEKWASDNLYCPKCGRGLDQYANNTPVYDFYCDHSDENFVVIPKIRENFQLKASYRFPKNNFPKRINSGEYNTAINFLNHGVFPSLILLHYDRAMPAVEDAMLVHRLSITFSCIIPRKKLSINARRAGWQGSYIALDRIPQLGCIKMIEDSTIMTKSIVQEKWASITKLLQGNVVQRGWTADVINFIEQMPKNFSLEDIYRYESQLSELHPQNKHVKDKIRQQLQVLRDRGYIRFITGKGRYERVS